MYCIKCGNEYKENEKFCPKCGQPKDSKVVINNEETKKEINENNNQQKDNVLAIFGLLCSIFCFGILGLILSILGLNESKKTNKGKTISIIGIVISSVKILVTIVFTILVMAGLVNAVDELIDTEFDSIIEKTDSNELQTVKINDVKITFPTTATELEKTGWKLDENKINSDIEKNKIDTINFGDESILSIVNNSNETKKIKDCKFNLVSFNKPTNDENNIKFVDNITFNNSLEKIKVKMSLKGYDDEDENISGKYTSIKYYKDDEDDNVSDYIEFAFYDGTMTTVRISSSIK